MLIAIADSHYSAFSLSNTRALIPGNPGAYCNCRLSNPWPVSGFCYH